MYVFNIYERLCVINFNNICMKLNPQDYVHTPIIKIFINEKDMCTRTHVHIENNLFGYNFENLLREFVLVFYSRAERCKKYKNM